MGNPNNEKIKVIRIPADIAEAVNVVEIRPAYPGFRDDTVGPTNFFEFVHPANMLTLQQRLQHGLVMIVDEEGAIKGLPQNHRASQLYYHAPIYGDAWVCGELYDTNTGDFDLVSVPSVLTPKMLANYALEQK